MEGAGCHRWLARSYRQVVPLDSPSGKAGIPVRPHPSSRDNEKRIRPARLRVIRSNIRERCCTVLSVRSLSPAISTPVVSSLFVSRRLSDQEVLGSVALPQNVIPLAEVQRSQ